MAILKPAMRRLSLLGLVLVLSLPVVAWAGGRLPGDGTLVVDNGRGSVTVKARGGILGRFDSGRLVIEDPIEGDGSGPVVYGADRIRDLGGHKTLYIGEDVRFRMIGGLYRVQVQAVGIDVSAVGRGTVTLDATGFTDLPGRFSINGDPFQPLPGHSTTYTLGQVQSAAPNGK
jgi:hypothetical protein